MGKGKAWAWHIIAKACPMCLVTAERVKSFENVGGLEPTGSAQENIQH